MSGRSDRPVDEQVPRSYIRSGDITILWVMCFLTALSLELLVVVSLQYWLLKTKLMKRSTLLLRESFMRILDSITA
jgi:hypothetical protein